MTMPENMGHDPEKTGALRGVLLIVVVGAALGIGYNAMGLAGRPRHGLAWVKQPEKIESLEALQGAPASGAMSEPGPGDAVAATMESSATSTASGSGTASTQHDSTAARHDSTAAAKSAKSKSKSASAKTSGKSASTSKGAASATATTAAAASAAPTSAPAAPAAASAPATGASGSAATGAAASDLPTIPDVTGPLKVELATFKKLYDASAALVIDAREAEEYLDGHIAGATSLPYNDAMAEPDKVKKLDPAGKPIVVYCSGGDCELSMDLAKLLVENGKRKVLVYEGGFPEWSGKGYAVNKGANP